MKDAMKDAMKGTISLDQGSIVFNLLQNPRLEYSYYFCKESTAINLYGTLKQRRRFIKDMQFRFFENNSGLLIRWFDAGDFLSPFLHLSKYEFHRSKFFMKIVLIPNQINWMKEGF